MLYTFSVLEMLYKIVGMLYTFSVFKMLYRIVVWVLYTFSSWATGWQTGKEWLRKKKYKTWRPFVSILHLQVPPCCKVWMLKRLLVASCSFSVFSATPCPECPLAADWWNDRVSELQNLVEMAVIPMYNSCRTHGGVKIQKDVVCGGWYLFGSRTILAVVFQGFVKDNTLLHQDHHIPLKLVNLF